LILQSLDALEKDLKAHKIFRCYAILGPEKYFCRQAIHLLKRGLISPEAATFNCTELSGESDPIEDVIAALNTFPMMSPLRLVVVSDAAKMGKEAQKRLAEYLENPCDKSVLILEADELDRRKDFFRTLKEVACMLDFQKLKTSELENWVARYASNRGYKISPSSVKRLVDLAGSDLQTVVNELEKLLLFLGSKVSISDADIETSIIGSRQHGIFELTTAIGLNDRIGALIHLNSLLDAGEEPLMVLSMLARHFRQVLVAKEVLSRGGSSREAADAAQIPGFLIEKFLGQIRKVSLEDAKKMLLRTAEADLRLKSTNVSRKMLLEILLCL
jgi:DNA polymerase III subunit delta